VFAAPSEEREEGKVQTMSLVLHQFAKNATEEVRVSLTEYKGHKLIDLRIYYEPEDGEERRPTKKGITIDVGLYPELKKAMLKIEKELLKQNLVEEEALEAIANE
jgi:hypothetical protein